MTQCPYCLSAVQAEASVCRVCSREIHLFRSLQDKITLLESQHLQKLHDSALAEQSLRRRIAELERQLQLERTDQMARGGVRDALEILQFFLFFLLLPCVLLLLVHALITVVYDLPLLWLQGAIVLLPLGFGVVLQWRHPRLHGAQMVTAVSVMALLAVVGMSTTTSYVDGVAVLPRHAQEWSEFIGYAVGIVASYLGGMAAARWWRRRTLG